MPCSASRSCLRCRELRHSFMEVKSATHSFITSISRLSYEEKDSIHVGVLNSTWETLRTIEQAEPHSPSDSVETESSGDSGLWSSSRPEHKRASPLNAPLALSPHKPVFVWPPIVPTFEQDKVEEEGEEDELNSYAQEEPELWSILQEI